MKANMTDNYPTHAYAEILTPFFGTCIWLTTIIDKVLIELQQQNNRMADVDNTLR